MYLYSQEQQHLQVAVENEDTIKHYTVSTYSLWSGMYAGRKKGGGGISQWMLQEFSLLLS